MKIKLTKARWAEAGIRAGWIKVASGVGKLDKDTSDVLEGKVLKNKSLPVADILNLVKQDSWLNQSILAQGVSDQELISYINDILMLFKNV